MNILKCFSEKACYLNVLSQTGYFFFHITDHFNSQFSSTYQNIWVANMWYEGKSRIHAEFSVWKLEVIKLWACSSNCDAFRLQPAVRCDRDVTVWPSHREAGESQVRGTRPETLQPSRVAVPRCSVTFRSTVVLPKRKTHVKRICHLPGFPLQAPNHTLCGRYQLVECKAEHGGLHRAGWGVWRCLAGQKGVPIRCCCVNWEYPAAEYITD